MFLSEKNLERLLFYNTTKGLAICFDGLGTHDWMRNFEDSEEEDEDIGKLWRFDNAFNKGVIRLKGRLKYCLKYYWTL